MRLAIPGVLMLMAGLLAGGCASRQVRWEVNGKQYPVYTFVTPLLPEDIPPHRRGTPPAAYKYALLLEHEPGGNVSILPLESKPSGPISRYHWWPVVVPAERIRPLKSMAGAP